jgi:hypothetical protein
MIEAIRQVVRQELARLVFGDVGQVVQVDWKQQRARVKLASSGQESGWLEIGTGYASQGDGSLAPIRAGDQVAVTFFEGRPGGQGIVGPRVYGKNAVPEMPGGALGAKRGQHRVLFDANGNIVAEVAGCSLQSAGEVSIDGSVVKLGGADASAVRFEQLDAALQALVALLASHTHLYVPALAPAPAAVPTLPPVPTPTLVLAPARALKVKVG